MFATDRTYALRTLTPRIRRGHCDSLFSRARTPVDTVDSVVHLNDSGAPDGADKTVSVEIFAKAWAASDDEIIVTDAIR